MMFSRGEQSTEAPVTQSESAPMPTKSTQIFSIISADLTIKGDLQSNGDIQIDGAIEGDVKSRSLTVSEGAQVDGKIEADKVTIAGTVSGEVHAGAVNIAKSARVHGDVFHNSLSIEAGAFLDGRFSHADDVKKQKDVKVSELKAARAEQARAEASGGSKVNYAASASVPAAE